MITTSLDTESIDNTGSATGEMIQQQNGVHHDIEDDYESDINELLKQRKRHKRRR